MTIRTRIHDADERLLEAAKQLRLAAEEADDYGPWCRDLAGQVDEVRAEREDGIEAVGELDARYESALEIAERRGLVDEPDGGRDD